MAHAIKPCFSTRPQRFAYNARVQASAFMAHAIKPCFGTRPQRFAYNACAQRACAWVSYARAGRFQAHMDAAILDQMRAAAVKQGDKCLSCALRFAGVFMLKRESIFARRLKLMLEP